MSIVKVVVYRNDASPESLVPLFDYRTDHVPAIGDRITAGALGMLVMGRTWRLEKKDFRVDLMVEIE